MSAVPAGSQPLRWHTTTLGGRRAVYGEAGEGPPLVLVHGWGLRPHTYARLIPVLASRGARVIAPALPGFGRSDPLPRSYTWPRLARWIDRLLDHIGVDEPASFVGHSLGGGVSVATAWHHPERVNSLVLVNSVGGGIWHGHIRRQERVIGERPLWSWVLTLPDEFVRGRSRAALPRVAVDFIGNAVRDPGAVWRAARLARGADLRQELAELSDRGLPITILWGDQDSVIPEGTFLALCQAAGSPGDIIEQGGHSWLLVDPEGFSEIATNSLAVARDAARDRSDGKDRGAGGTSAA